MEKIKVGIIGAGGIAQGEHIPGYQKIENVEVVAVAELNEEKARKVADQFGIYHVFSDYNEMLKLDEISAVSICTPNKFHAEASIAAMEADKHVLCEKPMAVNISEAEKMVEVAHRKNKILQIGVNFRFTAEAQQLKNLIESGRLGEIYYARAVSLRRRGIPNWGVFTSKDLSGGGALIDIGVHIIDLIIWLMGSPKPSSVFGSAMTKFGNRHGVFNKWGPWDVEGFDVDDFATGMVKFDNGAMMSIETSWASNIENAGGSFLLGTEGGLHVTDGGLKLASDRVFEQRDGQLADTPIELTPGGSAYESEIWHFINAIRNGEASPVPPEEILNVQKIMDAIYKSTETGKSVEL